MNRKSISTTEPCIASRKLLADFWTLSIIDALSHGELRYCELQRAVGGINPVTLATRLKKLEGARLIRRHESTVDKISVSYSLSPLGRDALPVLGAINQFSTHSNLTRS
jgi:DNA-binding HxlR family transcriptional regulator